MNKTIYVLTILLILTGCPSDYDFEYEVIVSDMPANLVNLNTSYDDYNSDLPYPASRSHLNFSSNRSGTDFDIVTKAIDISYHKRDNILNISVPTNGALSSYENEVISLINTNYDELGPYSFSGTQGWDYLFYSNNESGNFDIKFVNTQRLDWGTWNAQERLYGPNSVVIVNSESDELYPTINQDNSKLIFCSNRENDLFDIYSIDLNSGVLLHNDLTNASIAQVSKETVLSSLANDKCPSISGDIIIFASDREGGYGGYDLYYSYFTNNQWGTPINFGDKINSPHDEYRPIIFTFNEIDIMIFSSNRPGGKGGFDLYCVKVGNILK